MQRFRLCKTWGPHVMIQDFWFLFVQRTKMALHLPPVAVFIAHFLPRQFAESGKKIPPSGFSMWPSNSPQAAVLLQIFGLTIETQISRSLNCETIPYISFSISRLRHYSTCLPFEKQGTSKDEHDYFLWDIDMVCIISKEGHLENSRHLHIASQRIRGFARICIFPPSQIRLISMVFQYHNSESTYWAGDKLLHVHIHLSRISAQVSKEGTTHAGETSKLFVDTFQQPSPFKSAPQLTCNPCWQRDQVQVEKEHKTSLEKTSAGVGSVGKEAHVFTL